MGDLRVGLIGYGVAGEFFHAPLVTATDGLVLSDIASSQRDRIHQRWPRATIYGSPTAFFDRADVDVAVIATPNQFHYEHARRALECGWHVVVDKPFTLTVEEADELIDLARQRKRVLTVYQNRRWDGDFRTVRLLVEGGELGHVHHFVSHFDRYRPDVRDRWRERDVPGAGILYDLGPHLIDQALVLFGMPDWVHARIEKQRPGAVADDFFHLMMAYPDRTIILSAGMLVRQSGPRFRVNGRLGTFAKYGLDPQEAALRAGGSPADPGFGVEEASSYGQIETEIEGVVFEGRLQTLKGSYIDFYRGLVASIREGDEVPVRPEEAREVIRVIAAAFESDRTERRIRLTDSLRTASPDGEPRVDPHLATP